MQNLQDYRVINLIQDDGSTRTVARPWTFKERQIQIDKERALEQLNKMLKEGNRKILEDARTLRVSW